MSGSDEFIDSLYESTYNAARKLGISRRIAHDIAILTEQGIKFRHGSDRIYIPKQKTVKDEDLYQMRLTGKSYRQIADNCGLHSTTVIRRLTKYEKPVD